jgi:LmbE family N-acetylglucosaminyl deacetylase
VDALRTHRVLVVGPHLDDTPLSAVGLMRTALEAGSDITSITAFTAAKADGTASRWDRHLGFASSTEAMAARYEEDRRAMGLLGVRTRYLDLHEEQYREPGTTPEVARAMCDRLEPIIAEHDGPTVLAIPSGLGSDPSWLRMQRHKLSIPGLRVKPGGKAHPDHVLLRRTLLPWALERFAHVIVYEDLPYAWGGGYEGLLADLHADGRRAVRERIPVDLDLKERALRHYGSQFAMFLPKWSDRIVGVFEPYEHVWWVSRPSAN